MPPLRVLAALLLPGVLVACGTSAVHVHDRHSLSYPLVRDYAAAHPGSTLVLLDYHHDIGPTRGGVTSSNWVAALLEKGLVGRVVWVSGRTLQPPNRNSRLEWLKRSLAALPIDVAEGISRRVTLADWQDLSVMRFDRPPIVSLDLDLLAHDPGDPPVRFLDELSGWMTRQRPPLLTVALSAAYQPDAQAAWSWLARLAGSYAVQGAAWYLEAGPQVPVPEGGEELSAWRLWETQRTSDRFMPGAGVWAVAPRPVRDALLSRGVRPGDLSARDAMTAWSDVDRAALETDFPRDSLDALIGQAASSLEASWHGESLPEPPFGMTQRGFAVRLLSQGLDRGCLALYTGVTDQEAAVRYCAQSATSDPRYPPVLPAEAPNLDIELSVFGPWHAMNGPLDFKPGYDSLLLLDGGRTTLLQASLAVQRHYDRQAFLSVLSRKAGLGDEGWKRGDLVFKRSATIWRSRPLVEPQPVSESARNR